MIVQFRAVHGMRLNLPMPEVSICPLHPSMIFMNVARLVLSILSEMLATTARLFCSEVLNPRSLVETSSANKMS